MRIWFVVAVGEHVVCYQYRDDFPGYAEVRKKLFREEGTPVLAIVRPKLSPTYGRQAYIQKHSLQSSDPQVQYDELVPVIPHP